MPSGQTKDRIYVDEAGNADAGSSDDPDHRFLSLTGVVMDLRYVQETLHPEMEAIKQRFRDSHPDERKVIPHGFPKWFCLAWCRHHLPDFQAIASGKATTMGHIQRRHLGAARVLVHPRDLVDAMDGRLALLLDRHVASSVESRTLTALRDALLPKLVPGELRLNDAERFVGRAV